MSDTEEKNLEGVQRNQREIGDAASDPKTAGPAEKLREKAAEMNSDEDSSEPA